MTLYAWVDEHGNWRVSHFKPGDGSATLVIVLPDGTDAAFFTEFFEDVPVEARRG